MQAESRAKLGRERRPAEPARFALLGLLLARPAHGYDLSRQFAPRSPLADIIHLSASHLYALLGRLERDGLISGEQQTSGAHHQRRVYQLTERGRSAVLRWVEEPVTHPRDMRIDFPLKLYIARQLSPEQAAALIERQRAVFRAYIDRLEAQGEQVDGEAAFIALMRLGRIGRAQAALDWLDAARAMLDLP